MNRNDMIEWLVDNNHYTSEELAKLETSDVAHKYLTEYYVDVEELLNDNPYIAEGFGE